MKFNISFANLPDTDKDPKTLRLKTAWDDMTRYIYLALKSAGHTVTVTSARVEPDAVNIFFERFHDMQRGREIMASGLKYGLICTEPLTQHGVYNPFEYATDETRRLYAEFGEAAKTAEFVWCMLEEAVPACTALNSRSVLIEYRYVDGYPQMRAPELRGPPVVDYFTSGQPTKRRARIISELRQLGVGLNFAPWFEPDSVRIAFLEQSRAAISIQKSDEHSMYQLVRVYHSLMNRVPFLIEYDGPERYLSEYCVSAAPSGFVAAAVEFARRQDLQNLAQNFFDAFRAGVPARESLTETIDLTYSIPR
jgi:hypothetical protein